MSKVLTTIEDGKTELLSMSFSVGYSHIEYELLILPLPANPCYIPTTIHALMHDETL